MKYLTLLLVPVLLTGQVTALAKDVETIIRQLHDPGSKQLLVVAHRGDWRKQSRKFNPEH